jgi:site-specific recombinase XerD
MCYKQELQKRYELQLNERLKLLPNYIHPYFSIQTSYKTKVTNFGVIEKFLKWVIIDKELNVTIKQITPKMISKLRASDVIKYLDGLLSKGMKISSVVTIKHILGGFFAFLSDEQYFDEITNEEIKIYNAVAKITKNKYKLPKKKIKAPTEEEVTSLIIEVENSKKEFVALRDRAIVKLLKGSAIRSTELIGLDLENLELDAEDGNHINIMKKGDYYNLTRKQISDEAKMALDDYLKVRNRDDRFKNLNAVFVSEKKDKETHEYRRVSYSYLYKLITESSEKKITPHKIRHYTATMMYKNSGYNLELVREQLGHEDINTTSSMYVDNDKKQTFDTLNSF